jgi:hypothetical protein
MQECFVSRIDRHHFIPGLSVAATDQSEQYVDSSIRSTANALTIGTWSIAGGVRSRSNVTVSAGVKSIYPVEVWAEKTAICWS